ncbi:anthrone oxygenase family protein [Streptomyces physcomitrii]|uniref:DUF1772 domain-containing protein n=1 Tax=Streptomyces physcomitrii TaxID=2724184 RepID=A0ABX1GYW6_9ACTN|nr:anthrone oxygenase family protein [Streptomyces physcomitrii]NKI41291.1 DUF1772 domain-containing protein [Streptomyces physcomitrii]
MVEGPYFVFTVLAALACGLVAGVFTAFSAFVMRGLAALPPNRGLAAMQSINVAAVRPAFMALFLGAAVLSAVVAVFTLVKWPEEAAVELLLGAALYLAGSFGVTMAANVPRNTALAELDPEAPESEEPWRAYVGEWTAWNHIRAGAALAATACFLLALT